MTDRQVAVRAVQVAVSAALIWKGLQGASDALDGLETASTNAAITAWLLRTAGWALVALGGITSALKIPTNNSERKPK